MAAATASLAAALRYGKEYLWIMMLGLPAFMMAQIYVSTLRECGGNTGSHEGRNRGSHGESAV